MNLVEELYQRMVMSNIKTWERGIVGFQVDEEIDWHSGLDLQRMATLLTGMGNWEVWQRTWMTLGLTVEFR